MQKVINVLAVASFLVSGALAAGVATAYLQRETLRERVTSQITEAIEEAVSGAVEGAVGDLPNLLDGGGASGGNVGVPGGVMPF